MVEVSLILWYLNVPVNAVKGMCKYLKRLIAVCLVLVMAIGMVTVSASPPGSIGDPLISRSHLEGAIANAISSDARQILEGATADALSRVDALYMGVVGFDFAGRFTPVSIASGRTLSLGPGSSFTLTSGTATLRVNTGQVINISTGSIAQSGASLGVNQRFFTTENTTAVVTASSAVSGVVDGFFSFDETILQPPVQPPQQPEPPTNQPPLLIDTPTAPNLPGQNLPGSNAPLPFTDVPANAWFNSAVSFVYQNGLFSGTGAATFSPNTPMTRGMFVTVLHRLEGTPDVMSGATFTDVRNPEAFFYDAVRWANNNGVVTGFSDGTFRPNEPVTREQMAAIMHRYASYRGRDLLAFPTALDEFPDRGDVSSFARDSMQWAVTWQVIRGSAEGRLLPRNTASRAEVAQIIFNYSTNIG